MESAFGGATELARRSGDKLSKSTQLRLYTLFKQATEGDLPASKPRPSAFSVVERSKHDTWDALRGMTKPAAKAAYVQAVLEADIGFVMPATEVLVVSSSSSSATAVAIEEEEDEEQDNNNSAAAVVIEEEEEQEEAKQQEEEDNSSSSSSEEEEEELKPAVAPVPAPVAAPVKPTPVYVVPPPPPAATAAASSPLDTLLHAFSLPTLVCMGMFALGLGGFFFTILSWTALACLGFAFLGLGGMVGSLALYIDTHGLISVMPVFVKRFLLESTLLEFLLNDSFSRLVQQLLPLFLLKPDDPRLKQALGNLPPGLAQTLTQRGFVHSLPRFAQTLLVPSSARQVLLTAPPPVREMPQFPPVAAEDQAKLLAAKQLTGKLVKEQVGLGLRHVFTPQAAKVLEMVSVSLASAAAIQLVLSSSNRAFLLGFLRALALLASMLGSGVAGALGIAAKLISARSNK